MIANLSRRNPFGSFFELVDWNDSWSNSQDSTLRVDLREKDTSYELAADVPGVIESDLDISYENQVLTVAVEKTNERSDETARYRIKERKYNKQSRSFHLPDICGDEIKASLKNGVLTVVAPKTTKAKTKKITVDCE